MTINTRSKKRPGLNWKTLSLCVSGRKGRSITVRDTTKRANMNQTFGFENMLTRNGCAWATTLVYRFMAVDGGGDEVKAVVGGGGRLPVTFNTSNTCTANLQVLLECRIVLVLLHNDD